MFTSYYGFREQPFSLTPNPRYLYLGAAHREAAAALYFGLHSRRGLLTLTGPAGVGRTILLAYLLDRFRTAAYRPALVHAHPATSLLAAVANELGVAAGDDDARSIAVPLLKHLQAEARLGRRAIVAIDDAQHLGSEDIDAIRLLSDLETRSEKLVQIILSGQPALADMLARRELAWLAQRITVAARLTSLSAADTRRYIAHRFEVAGREAADLFTDAAVMFIAGATGGVPRAIDNLCFGALTIGCALHSRSIDVEIVEEALADLNGGAERPVGGGARDRAAEPGISLEEFSLLLEQSWGTGGPMSAAGARSTPGLRLVADETRSS